MLLGFFWLILAPLCSSSGAKGQAAFCKIIGCHCRSGTCSWAPLGLLLAHLGSSCFIFRSQEKNSFLQDNRLSPLGSWAALGLLLGAFTQKSFYTKGLFHRKTFTQKGFYTRNLSIRRAFTQKGFYTEGLFTQKPRYQGTKAPRHHYTSGALKPYCLCALVPWCLGTLPWCFGALVP